MTMESGPPILAPPFLRIALLPIRNTHRLSHHALAIGVRRSLGDIGSGNKTDCRSVEALFYMGLYAVSSGN